jgi:uncharacterized repeat protein (TIGR02543 family)
LLLVGSLAGCRIIGDYPGADATEPTSLNLSGKILLPSSVSSALLENRQVFESRKTQQLSGNLPAKGARVWIEELPSVPSVLTDENGSYFFRNIPPGVYRIVADLRGTDNSLQKVRSEAVEANSQSEQVNVPEMALTLATKAITGILRDTVGNPLPPGTILRLWGERFEVQNDGSFTSPPLPNDATEERIVVELPGTTGENRPWFEVSFHSSQVPTVIDVSLPPQATEKSLAAVLKVLGSSGELTRVEVNERVKLVTDSVNTESGLPQPVFSWTVTSGNLEFDSDTKSYAYWTAPDDPGMASISVKITRTGYGSCYVELAMLVGLDTPIDSDQNGPTVAGKNPAADSTTAKVSDAIKISFSEPIDKTGVLPENFRLTLDGNPIENTLSLSPNGRTVTLTPASRLKFSRKYTVAVSRSVKDLAGNEMGKEETWSFSVETGTGNGMVTFDPNGGSGTMAQQSLSIANPTPLSPNAFSRSGFAFAGWSTTPTGTVEYPDQGNLTLETDALILYAQWKTGVYTLTYSAGTNGTLSGTTPQIINQGANGTPVTAAPNAGYAFVKWSDGITENPRTDTNVTADTSVTAEYIGKNTVTYNGNGNTGGSVPADTGTYAPDATVTVAGNSGSLSRTGYSFGGWNTAADGSGITHAAGAAFQMGNSGVTLYVKWIINTYTLTYSAGTNGSISGTSPQTVNHGANGTAVTGVPASGYHLVKWSDGKTDNPRTDTNISSNITVSSEFAANYAVTYEANGNTGGTVPTDAVTYAPGATVTAAANSGTLVKTNYSFSGWNTAPDGSGTTYSPGATFEMGSANLTLYAKWIINSYTLTYTASANGSLSGTSPQTVNHGANGTAVTAVPASGYHFVKWSDDTTSNPRTDTNVTGNITVSAVFANAGNCAQFTSASSSYIRVPDSASLDVTTAMTMETWFKPVSGGGEWSLLFGKQYNSADSDPWYCYRFYGASANAGEKGFPRKVYFGLSVVPQGTETGVKTTSIIPINTWTHLAGTYDGTNLKIYVNGVLENTVPTTGSIRTSNLPLFMGKAPWTPNNNLNGQMDEVRVWNVARTQAQIVETMKKSLVGNETGLVGYWSFNEALGAATTADGSPNGNTGTFNNGATISPTSTAPMY